MAVNFIQAPTAASINSGPVTPDIAQQLALAQALRAQGGSTAPIYNAGGLGWAEGIARLANGLLGGYEARKAGEAQTAQQKSVAQTLAEAAQAGSGAKPWVSPDTFQGNNGTVDAGSVAPGTSPYSAMAHTLAGNPLTASLGANVALEGVQHDQGIADKTREMAQQFSNAQALASQSQGATAKNVATAQAGENARQAAGFANTNAQPIILPMGAEAATRGTGNIIARNTLTNPRSMAAAAVQNYIAEGDAAGTPRTADDIAAFNGKFQAQAAADRAFVGNGIDAKFVDSANSLGGHLNTLQSLSTALQNGDFPAFNTLAQGWARQTGNPAPTNFETAKNIIGGEIVKAIVGAGGGEGDREKAQAAFSAASSPAQLAGAVQTAKDIFQTQVDAKALKFTNIPGNTRAEFVQKLTPQAQRTFGFSQGADTAAPTSGAIIVPKTQADIDNAPSGSLIQTPTGVMRKP